MNMPDSLTWGQGKPEPQVAVADARLDPVAIRRARAGGKVAPTAAALDAEGTGRRPRRVIPWALVIILIAIPVTTPFPDIAAHIM